jgi:putative ABC transport system permease protein
LLPQIPFYQADAACVLGYELRQQLFGARPALGQWVRAGDRRFRVMGVLQEVGEGLGFDMDDAMLVPVASAQALFNQESLLRIFVEVRAEPLMDSAKRDIRDLMIQRHDGDEDVTLVAQDAVLSSFESILDTMALAVVGIAAISMLVAGILIMNIMLITVGQRTQEIGLLKALGANSATVRQLFLSEAGMMALTGALLGMGISEVLLLVGRELYPDLAFSSPWWAKGAALVLALLTALLFAWIPAQKAAAMSPVDALLDKREGD